MKIPQYFQYILVSSTLFSKVLNEIDLKVYQKHLHEFSLFGALCH